jgi:hypothetical protein
MIADLLLNPLYAPLYLLGILVCVYISRFHDCDTDKKVEVAVHVVPWAVDKYGYNRGPGGAVPGPLLAKISNIWLGKVAASGKRSVLVHNEHKKYGESKSFPASMVSTDGRPGTFVRIAPNHISISDPNALAIVYGVRPLITSRKKEPLTDYV